MFVPASLQPCQQAENTSAFRFQKAAADRELAEARRTIAQLKASSDMLTSAQTQQEAEHAQVLALTAKIKEMEAKQGAVRSEPTAAGPSHTLSSKPAGALVRAGDAPAPVLRLPSAPAPGVAGSPGDTAAQGQMTKQGVPTGGGEVIAVIIFACCRKDYLARTLDTLFQRMPTVPGKTFEVWVSQDGEDSGVKDLIRTKYPSPKVHHVQHIDHSPLGKASRGESDNYYKIARHYGWGFKQVFAHTPCAAQSCVSVCVCVCMYVCMYVCM